MTFDVGLADERGGGPAKRRAKASTAYRGAARAACRGRGHLAEVDDWPAQVPPPQGGYAPTHFGQLCADGSAESSSQRDELSPSACLEPDRAADAPRDSHQPAVT